MSTRPKLSRRFGVAVVLAGFGAGAVAQPAVESGGGPASAKTVGPRIELAEPFYDFGRVEAGKIVNHNFIFTNTGDQTLEISDVQSSCGCTVATNWNRRVEPGKTGSLPVLFNTGGMAGPTAKNLWVVCNDPSNSPALIEFTATIWKLIDAIPAIATFTFGPDFQTNDTRVIRLVNNLPEPVTLSEPVCTNRAFKAELKTVQPGKEFELRVTVVPPLGPGSLTVPITLKTSTPKMPEVTVTAYAMVQPALTVTPPKITLPAMLAEGGKFVVTIRNNATQPVTLSDAAINAKGAEVQLREVQPGRIYNLAVTFPAGFQCPAGERIEARLKSNCQQSPVLTVPVMQLQPLTTD